MRLTPAQAAKLAKLAIGESLPKSDLPKSVLLPLQKARVVKLEPSGSSYVVRGLPGKLATFVEQHWGVSDLTKFAAASPLNRSREMLAEIADDSKALPSRPLEGIFIRPFGKCYFHGKELAPLPMGSAVFVSPGELSKLEVREEHLIGIENSRCFLNFEKCFQHFDTKGLAGVTLVLRWSWGTAWRNWLREWKGSLAYFPDYDPSGMSIFASEVLPLAPNASLLIPSNLEGLLEKRGKRALYVSQERFLSNLPGRPDITSVTTLLQKHRKGLEQEKLLF